MALMGNDAGCIQSHGTEQLLPWTTDCGTVTRLSSSHLRARCLVRELHLTRTHPPCTLKPPRGCHMHSPSDAQHFPGVLHLSIRLPGRVWSGCLAALGSTHLTSTCLSIPTKCLFLLYAASVRTGGQIPRSLFHPVPPSSCWVALRLLWPLVPLP